MTAVEGDEWRGRRKPRECAGAVKAADAPNTVGDVLEAERVVQLAAELGMRIAVAESLTGGLMCDALVSVPGASKVFSGGVVAYDTALKHSLLGVSADVLAARGPVDSEVAMQMARGARSACAVPGSDDDACAPGGREATPGAGLLVTGAMSVPRPTDLGIATTGVAGPESDPQTGQAAGTVWVGVSSRRGERAAKMERIAGGRAEIRIGAVRAALDLLLNELQFLRPENR